MLALMAGRNVKETSTIVQNGQVGDLVKPPQSTLTRLVYSVVCLSLGTLPVGWLPAQCKLGKPYSDCRLPRIWAHRPVHSGTPPPLRVHTRALRGQPLVAT